MLRHLWDPGWRHLLRHIRSIYNSLSSFLHFKDIKLRWQREQDFPFTGTLRSQPAIKASLKLITGLRNVEDRNHCCLLKRLATLTRREPQVLVLGLSFIRQVSAGGDERAGEGGEAVFADLAEFSRLLLGCRECSAGPFDCCLLNLLFYNEPVLFWISRSRVHKESQLYLH